MTSRAKRTAEHQRLDEARVGKKWRRWGTYLSERQWGTVREDYSSGGDAWDYLTHEHARSRAYRWGDDGLLGLCDNRGLLNLALSLWNGRDPFLKERLFGLGGTEGNHGEDVKELYFYVDATPTCSYARALYKYPQRAFPYDDLRRMSFLAGRQAPEPEIWDTRAFEDEAYFDVQVEYAKADTDDILVRYVITNRGDEAEVEVLPTLWFRNTWSWGREEERRPTLHATERKEGRWAIIEGWQSHLGSRYLYAENARDLVFTENETNAHLLYGVANRSAYVKDAFHALVCAGTNDAVNPTRTGTKAAARYRLRLKKGERAELRLRLSAQVLVEPFYEFDAIFAHRITEADEFYDALMPRELGEEERLVYRQAMAGLIWTKQYYCLDVDRWLRGDAAYPPPPPERKRGRNHEWRHLYNSEVLSVPDKWEYPWYAAWDLAFHTIPLSLVDPDFAKQQLTLLLREWYMHPNGQLPAYEWKFSDVNPPVHAWAALRVYQIDRRQAGHADRDFLESVFHKLILNFTWWVNRKDASGNNVFEGGFLGLDNIGVFDRSNAPLPEGGLLEQADATSWMGMYCLNLLTIGLELAKENPSYQDVATKFFEHFLFIAHAINDVTGEGVRLWDEEDGFYYDVLHLPNGMSVPMRVRSMVGLIPLFAVDTLEPLVLERFPGFVKRMRWLIDNRPELAEHIASVDDRGVGERRLLAILDRNRLVRVLHRMLDEREFLSPYGVRALSRVHKDQPYVLHINGSWHRVDYEPAESQSGLFGGNSNWRGPIWLPVNYLIIESLQKFHHYYGDELRVECPTGSGQWMTLWEVACELSRRVASLFLPGSDGQRPADGKIARVAGDRGLVTFHEYFHGDTGEGLGASHQTGWTALVAKLLQQSPLWTAASMRRPPVGG